MKEQLALNYGQALAAFDPAQLENVSSSAAAHSLKKAVFALAGNRFWLVSPFWHFILSQNRKFLEKPPAIRQVLAE